MMDSVTQIALGAAIGDIVGGEEAGKRGALWGAVAGMVPDLDILFRPLYSQSEYFLFHRGLSHSLLFIVLLAPLMAFIITKIHPKTLSFKKWWLLVFLGLFTHPLLDILTIYGTGFFEPFSSARLAIGSINIVDPIYTLPLLIPLIVLIFRARTKRMRRLIAGFFVFSHLYLLLTIANSFYITGLFKQKMKEQGITYNKIMAAPSFLNNVLWYAVAVDDTHAWYGLYSHFDNDKNISFIKVPRNLELADQVPGNDMKNLKTFSKGFYVLQNAEKGVVYNDLRFGFTGEKTYVFNYKVNDPESGSFISRLDKDALARFFKRVFGNKEKDGKHAIMFLLPVRVDHRFL